MPVHRRTILAAAPSLATWFGLPKCALAETPPPSVEVYEKGTGGRVGFYALNLSTGTHHAWRAYERFVMCSTFKASLAARVLWRVDHGQESLDRMILYGEKDLFEYAPVARQNLAKGQMSVAEMCKAAVELSDNTCANLLLASVGGPQGLTRFWRDMGDRTSRLDHTEPMLNRSPPGDPHDTTTPMAMAGVLRRLVLGETLSPGSRERLVNWMQGCKTGDNRLRAGLPKTWSIGDKTGNNGGDAAGDIAVVWPRPLSAIVICAYVQGGSPKPAEIDAVFAKIGRLVAERLSE